MRITFIGFIIMLANAAHAGDFGHRAFSHEIHETHSCTFLPPTTPEPFRVFISYGRAPSGSTPDTADVAYRSVGGEGAKMSDKDPHYSNLRLQFHDPKSKARDFNGGR